MFAATATTIVSGAVCERIRLMSFLIFSSVYVALVYPWRGSWAWGGGRLKSLGFHDFPGSTPVDPVGCWAALVGGHRGGPTVRQVRQRHTNPVMGHNPP